MGLNATVTPGITVTSSTVLSAANLNLLGTPTVSVTGTIDSSDIGANTVGTSELIDNSVTAAKIGDIGDPNYIISGDSSGNGVGISTLAQDGSTNKISLLVNDTSTLKARFITGSLNVTAATTTDDGNTSALDLTIKDDIITNAMLKNDAVKAHIGNIQPGGGKNAVGGKASTGNGGAGLIVFDPSAQDTIGDESFYGKAKVLQPTRANQVLISGGGETSPLAFGSIPGMPDAFVHAYSPVYRGHTTASGGDIFTKLFGTGVYGIKREHQLTGVEAYGVLLVVFNAEIFSENDNVGVMGNAISGNYDHAGHMPFVHAPVALARFNESLEIVTDTAVEEKPYLYVKWLISTRGSGTIGENGVLAPQDSLQDGSGLFMRNVNACNMSFYKY